MTWQFKTKSEASQMRHLPQKFRQKRQCSELKLIWATYGLTLTWKDGTDAFPTLPQGPFHPKLLQDGLHGTQHL